MRCVRTPQQELWKRPNNLCCISIFNMCHFLITTNSVPLQLLFQVRNMPQLLLIVMQSSQQHLAFKIPDLTMYMLSRGSQLLRQTPSVQQQHAAVK
jgi:hypothetical protein